MSHIKIVALLLLITGVGLLLYVPLATYVNDKHATKVVASYSGLVSELPASQKETIIQSAQAYNEKLLSFSPLPFSSQIEGYSDQLNVSGTNVMGRIVSEKAGVNLPIYHGTDDSSLMSGAGHLSGSSLPIGGMGTHCVLMGHTGMPETKLFDGLQDMEVGDQFSLEVLGEKLEYRTDSIKTVLPEELNELQIDENEDRCTLVTCTPYGINSHRLLVSGVRVRESDSNVSEEAGGITPSLTDILPLVGGSTFLMAIFAIVLFAKRRKRKKETDAFFESEGKQTNRIAKTSSITKQVQERSISYAKNGW